MIALAILLGLFGLPAAAEEQTSKTFAFATYKEADNRVTLLLSSKWAALLPEIPYFPLLVGVGVREEGPPIVVSRASFVLIDPQGTVHTMAPLAEVREQGVIPFFRELVRREPLVTGRTFAGSHLASSIFYPVTGAAAGKERSELTHRSHLIDLIYFPRPESGLEGVLTVQFMARGLDKPIQVRFEVPGIKDGNPANSKTADD